MNFFGMWSITIIVSSICEFINELKIFKDFADAGYKFNVEKLKDIQTNIVPNATSNSKISMYIPFYNLYTVMQRKTTYEKNKEMIFEQYEKLGVLEEMTDEEKENYAKNPTGWNAIAVAAQNSINRTTKKEANPQVTSNSNNEKQIVKMIIIEENNQTNIVTVRMNTQAENDTLEILELDGPVSSYSKEELEKYIIENMDLIMQNKNISLKRTEELIEITLTKTKPKTKLERYIELRDSLKEQGYLIGEEMWEYKELKEELEPTLKLTK